MMVSDMMIPGMMVSGLRFLTYDFWHEEVESRSSRAQQRGTPKGRRNTARPVSRAATPLSSFRLPPELMT